MNGQPEVDRAGGMEEREALDKIMLALRAFSHGAWAQMNLSRLALFGRNLTEATSGAANERLRKAAGEYGESVYPLIGNIADQLQSVAIDPKVVQNVRFHSDELANMATLLSGTSEPSSEQLQKCEVGIPQHVDRLLDAFRVIRKGMMAEFPCDAESVLKRVVERRQAGNRRGKVVLPRDFSDQHRVVVIGEAEFLRVVEVLIDWAFAQGDGELSLDVKTSQERWMLEMRHDGLFLPPDRWHEVFTDDTGLASDNLSAVPEILSKYDGDICVKASSEDSGTTLLVRLRLMHA
jgi:hypothetical protein